MKIEISWGSFRNIKLHGKNYIEIEKEEWEIMSEDEREEYILNSFFVLSGVDYNYEIVEE